MSHCNMTVLKCDKKRHNARWNCTISMRGYAHSRNARIADGECAGTRGLDGAGANRPTWRERLAPSETVTALAAVQRLREDNHDMTRSSNFILITLEGFGANQLPEQQRYLLNESRAQYHDCVGVPSIDRINPNDQLRDVRQK